MAKQGTTTPATAKAPAPGTVQWFMVQAPKRPLKAQACYAANGSQNALTHAAVAAVAATQGNVISALQAQATCASYTVNGATYQHKGWYKYAIGKWLIPISGQSAAAAKAAATRARGGNKNAPAQGLSAQAVATPLLVAAGNSNGPISAN